MKLKSISSRSIRAPGSSKLVVRNEQGQYESTTAPGQQSPEAKMSSRDRAIAMLQNSMSTGAQAASTPQGQTPTPTVAPEAAASSTISVDSRQTNTNVDPASSQTVTEGAPSTPATTTPSPTSKPDTALSSQYAILARKEKALRQREMQIKAKEAASTTPATPSAPTFDPSKYVAIEDLVKSPFEVLSKNGLGYEQLTEMALNAPKASDMALMNKISELEAKVKSLQTDTESTKKSFEQQTTAQREQAVKQINRNVQTLVTNNPEFETIAATNSSEDVTDLIVRTLDEQGILLTEEEAAQKVEEYLVDEALKIARLKKIQQKLTPTQAAGVQKEQQVGEVGQQQLKTLTNSIATQTTKLSGRERAILAFQGKLK